MSNNTSDNFLKGISVQTIVYGFSGILQVVVFAIFSRILSKTDFGYYAALNGITMIFIGISDAGIGSAVIQQKNLTKKYSATAFTVSLILGALIALLFFLISPWLATFIIDEKLILPLQLMSIPLLLNGMSGFAASSLKRDLKFVVVGKCRLLSYIISAIVGIIYGFYGGGVYALVLLFILDSVLYTIFVFSNIPFPGFSIGRQESKSALSFGGWLTLGVIMSTIANQLDKLVLGKWLSVSRLGAYNRPSGFVMHLIGQMNLIFDSVLFPILSTFQDSKEKFRSVLYSSYKLLSTFGVMLAFILFFNANLIITIFFGSQWQDLVIVLKIMSLSAVFMLNNTLADCFFRSFNLVKAGFFVRTFGVILTLSFLYIGAQYDIVGVAVSILLSNFLVVIIKIVYLCIKSEASCLKMLSISARAWIPSVPIILVGLAFVFLPSTFIVQIVLLLAIGLVALYELVQIPQFIGQEYVSLIYPKIASLKSKISHR